MNDDEEQPLSGPRLPAIAPWFLQVMRLIASDFFFVVGGNRFEAAEPIIISRGEAKLTGLW
ncbi:MAG: hypothetical protein ACPL4N_00445 [Candidatus Norongarragalinales archaeon]